MVFSPNSETDPNVWQREIFFYRIKQKRRKAWIHTWHIHV